MASLRTIYTSDSATGHASGIWRRTRNGPPPVRFRRWRAPGKYETAATERRGGGAEARWTMNGTSSMREQALGMNDGGGQAAELRPALDVWPILLMVSVLVCVVIVSLAVVSFLRVYIGGESTWSKSQKDAVIYLIRYAETGDERAYKLYEAAIDKPYRLSLARAALRASRPIARARARRSSRAASIRPTRPRPRCCCPRSAGSRRSTMRCNAGCRRTSSSPSSAASRASFMRSSAAAIATTPA